MCKFRFIFRFAGSEFEAELLLVHWDANPVIGSVFLLFMIKIQGIS